MSSHPLFHPTLEAVHPKDMFKLVCLSFSVFATLIWLEILGSLSYPQRQQLLHQPHAIKSLTFLDMLRKYIPSGLDFWENVAYDGLCILLIFGLGMIRESHFLQMHWCLVLDAQGSIKELVTRMSNPLYSDPPKSNAVQWLCSRDSTPVANLYISRLHLEVLHGALPQQGTRVSAIWVTRGVTEARAYRACQLGKGLICAGGLWCSTGVLVCCL